MRGRSSFDWVNFQAKVEAEDLEEWVSQHGPLPSKCLVLMRWAKFSLFQFSVFSQLKKNREVLPLGSKYIIILLKKGAVGESSTTRTRQNSWAEKTRLSRHSSFLVLAPLGSTGHHLCYHLVLRIFHEKKKNTRYLDFFKAREKL